MVIEMVPKIEEKINSIITSKKMSEKESEKLRETLTLRYQHSLIEPGEAAGVVSAQSLGEPGTQMTMNTKHFVGIADMNITLGLPRIIEIFDAKKEPSTPMMTIFLKSPINTNEAEARKIAAKILEIKVENIVSNIDVDLLNLAVDITLDESLLQELHLSREDIEEALSKSFKKYIIKKGKSRLTIVPSSKIGIKELYKMKVKVMTSYIRGIKNISQVVSIKERGEFVIKTAGSNLSEVLKMEGVDTARTTTNNVFEIKEVLGIEAARNGIMKEILGTLEEQGLRVDIRHIMLIADAMTQDGEIKGVGRYGVSGQKASVLARASFEVPLNHLFHAATMSEVDELKSIVENVMINQPVPIGTGLPKLVVNNK